MKWWPWALAAVALLVLLVYGTLFSGWFRNDLPTHDDANVTLEPVLVAGGFDDPTLVTHAGDDRLFVVEQAGRVHVLDPGDGDRRVWLDITDRVRAGGERGLLGLAFPDDHADGAFYVHYSDADGDTVLSRFHAPGNGTADPESEQVLLRRDQPYPNHNGGTIVFGPDGFLYMGLGDGGLAADPHGNGQDPGTILGTILRLDVSGNKTEALPAPGNPFEDGGGDPRVWHYGLRNPWRFSFDARGNMWIGDVGQDHAEEIDFAPAGEGGLNFGWVVYEGSQKYRSGEAPGHVPPVVQYDHDGGHCSVTGGFVWDHDDAGPLRETYVFGDYCSGTVWSHEPGGETRIVARTPHRISSFGEDADGRLYLVDHGGAVYRLRAE